MKLYLLIIPVILLSCGNNKNESNISEKVIIQEYVPDFNGSDSMNVIIKKKTGKDICYIMDDWWDELHKNNVFIKEKYNNTWPPESAIEQSRLDSISSDKIRKKYKLTIQESVDMSNVCIDICKPNYE